MKFTYKAERDGETYTDTIEATDRFEVYRHVRAEGGTVISVTSEAQNNWSLTYWNSKFSTVKEHDKIVFASNLAAMISAGLPISRALSVAERQAKNPKLKSVILHVRGDIQKGGTFHEALGRFPNIFSKLFVAMVRAGEESGTLDEALTTVGNQLQRSYELKKKIKGALIYPSIIVVAIVGIGFLMMTEVVPTLSKTFTELGADLPKATQAIINVSDFLVNYTLLVLLGVLGSVAGVYGILRTAGGQRGRDKILLTTPLIGELVKEINAARTARTFASLLAAGVDILTALQITGEVVQNHYHKDVLKAAAEKVQKGGQLSDTFMKREDLYPPLMGEMIAVGEETGALADMLLRVATFYEGEVEQKTKNMSTIIEPFLMLIIGVTVGFFAVAMIGPIYSLSEAF
ncbi:type II secretion system F family protein [Candidatus Kaiserbacteria bacterium]|nr:MAG: type II secretion system F family protein [Candidatus Kaiserbacteria bacterium]